MTIPVLIIDNYDSFTYNLYQLIQESVNEPVQVHRNDKLTFAQVQELKPCRIVLSPGPGRPSSGTNTAGVWSRRVGRRSSILAAVVSV